MQSITREELTSSQGPLPGEKIKKINSVTGGCIHQAWHIEMHNDVHIFAKTTSREKFLMLQFEADCLKILNKYSDENLLTIPCPIALQQLTRESILLMPWLDIKNGNELNLGKGLALLHKNSSESNFKKFGWDKDGFIGTEIQKSGWSENWGEAFVRLRLTPQLEIARQWGLKPSKYDGLLKSLITFLNAHQPIPSIVHGDLWGGNKAVDSSGKGVIFDPASWWADREVDIAMTKMFGGFSNEFYDGYNDIWKLDVGFNQRVDIYNLYHLLNHANMFGGSYQEQSLKVINGIKYMI